MLGGLVTLVIVAVVAGLIFGASKSWARRQGYLREAPIVEGAPKRHVSLLTEAIGYIGAILVLAGGGAAIGQRWSDISDWGHVSIFAGGAAFFLAVGAIAWAGREAAFHRLASVVWFVSVGGVAGAVGFAAHDIYGHSGGITTLSIGVAITLYAGALWLVRRHALQSAALFAGMIVAICGAIVAQAGEHAPSLAFAFALWGFGLVWALLGYSRYVEPMWATVPLGAALALIAPSFATGDHGWMYAIGIVTAAAMLGASVLMRYTVFLAFGTLTMFGYVTSAVVRYFKESIGVPAALAITGVIVLGLAAVSARLMRATREPEPAAPHDEEGTEEAMRKVS